MNQGWRLPENFKAAGWSTRPMNHHVNAIAGRLSLRPSQRHSLEILDRVTEIVPPKKGVDVAAALEAIRSEYPTVTDFEREFPSLCFALATGVGKTRLMSALSAISTLPMALTTSSSWRRT